MEAASGKKQGRPRDEGARRRVLDTVRALLRSGSLCGLTMEGIAREAGVGKVTIYRWWPGVADVALEALLEEAGEACPVPDTGSLTEDLRSFLRQMFRLTSRQTGPLLRCLMMEAQRDKAFHERFRSGFIRCRQEALAELLSRHKPGPTPVSVIVDMIFGTLWYRLLIGHAPLDDKLADETARAAITLLGGKRG
jgi:AcrR family transcriptional regulator